MTGDDGVFCSLKIGVEDGYVNGVFLRAVEIVLYLQEGCVGSEIHIHETLYLCWKKKRWFQGHTIYSPSEFLNTQQTLPLILEMQICPLWVI